MPAVSPPATASNASAPTSRASVPDASHHDAHAQKADDFGGRYSWVTFTAGQCEERVRFEN